jgi:hypothetical protein
MQSHTIDQSFRGAYHLHHEAAGTFETMVYFYDTTQCKITEDRYLQLS